MSAASTLPAEKPLAYHEVRDQIEDGDVILFRGDRKLSSLIAHVSRGPYSHCGLVLTWFGRRMLLSAEHPRVQALPLGLAVAGYRGRTDWYRLVPEARAQLDRERLATEALTNLGIEYGTVALASLAAHYTLGRHLDEHTTDGAPDSLVCSQFVARCFRLAGLPLTDGTDLEITPGMLAASPRLALQGTLKSALTNLAELRSQHAI